MSLRSVLHKMLCCVLTFALAGAFVFTPAMMEASFYVEISSGDLSVTRHSVRVRGASSGNSASSWQALAAETDDTEEDETSDEETYLSTSAIQIAAVVEALELAAAAFTVISSALDAASSYEDFIDESSSKQRDLLAISLLGSIYEGISYPDNFYYATGYDGYFTAQSWSQKTELDIVYDWFDVDGHVSLAWLLYWISSQIEDIDVGVYKTYWLLYEDFVRFSSSAFVYEYDSDEDSIINVLAGSSYLANYIAEGFSSLTYDSASVDYLLHHYHTGYLFEYPTDDAGSAYTGNWFYLIYQANRSTSISSKYIYDAIQELGDTSSSSSLGSLLASAIGAAVSGALSDGISVSLTGVDSLSFNLDWGEMPNYWNVAISSRVSSSPIYYLYQLYYRLASTSTSSLYYSPSGTGQSYGVAYWLYQLYAQAYYDDDAETNYGIGELLYKISSHLYYQSHGAAYWAYQVYYRTAYPSSSYLYWSPDGVGGGYGVAYWLYQIYCALTYTVEEDASTATASSLLSTLATTETTYTNAQLIYMYLQALEDFQTSNNDGLADILEELVDLNELLSSPESDSSLLETLAELAENLVSSSVLGLALSTAAEELASTLLPIVVLNLTLDLIATILSVDAVEPVFDVVAPIGDGSYYTDTYDLSFVSSLLPVFRAFVLVLYALGLAGAFKGWVTKFGGDG